MSSFFNSNLLASFLVTGFSFVAISTLYYYKNHYNYWRKKNVKGPTPFPFIGNLPTILFSDRMKLDLEWLKKYGKVYGTYQGKQPVLVVCDPEVVNQICIKDFDAFPNHEHNEFYNKFQKTFVFALRNEDWKRVRTLMTPTFTSGKIKRMFKFLNACADDIVSCFAEQMKTNNKSKGEKSAILNVKEMYGLFTMDAITTCCYGLKLERSSSTNLKGAASRNALIKDAMRIFEVGWWRLIVVAAAPKQILRYFNIYLLPLSRFLPLVSRIGNLMESRQKSNKTFDDFLQLLIDAKLDDKLELDELDNEENHHAGLTNQSLTVDQEKMFKELNNTSGGKIKMSDLEVMSNCVFLLAVGLETTSNLLCNATYALAFHKSIQNKLYEEIRNIAEYNEDKSKIHFSYEALTSCRYLDAVLSETLRRLTPVVQIDRIAERDYHIDKYNIDVPKGGKLILGFHGIMNDSDNWYKPEKFDPERFMPGNKEIIVPGSYCPFGVGPRHCIGMRFSLTEAKLALAKMVMNFKFEPAPGTAFPPTTKNLMELCDIKRPLVRIVSRE